MKTFKGSDIIKTKYGSIPVTALFSKYRVVILLLKMVYSIKFCSTDNKLTSKEKSNIFSLLYICYKFSPIFQVFRNTVHTYVKIQ